MCGKRGLDGCEYEREFHADLLRIVQAAKEVKMKPIPFDMIRRGEF